MPIQIETEVIKRIGEKFHYSQGDFPAEWTRSWYYVGTPEAALYVGSAVKGDLCIYSILQADIEKTVPIHPSEEDLEELLAIKTRKAFEARLKIIWQAGMSIQAALAQSEEK